MTESSFVDTLISAFAAMSGWEMFAALLGVGYIVFAARESQWCWPLAFISTLIYTALFWEGQLPMQALLNVYYMGMAVYGYLLWRQHKHPDDTVAIHSWPVSYHLIFLLTGGLLTWLIGYYLSAIDASQSPYLDAGVTVFSVLNTWLLARKVL